MALKDLMASKGDSVADRTPPAPGTPQPAPHPARTVQPSTRIDAGTELIGKIRSRETVRVDGHIEGEIQCEKDVLVGKPARIHAAIDAVEVSVAGEVKGNISASRKITLEATARVAGDLRTPGIVIEEGAKLEGRIEIGAESQPEAKAGRSPRAETEVEAPAPAAGRSQPSRPPSASV